MPTSSSTVDPSSTIKAAINTMQANLQNAETYASQAKDIYNFISNSLDYTTVTAVKTCLTSLLNSIQIIQNNIAFCNTLLANTSLFDQTALQSKIAQSADAERNTNAQLQAIQNYALNIRVSIFGKMKNFIVSVLLNIQLSITQLFKQIQKSIEQFWSAVFKWFQQASVQYFLATGIGYAVFGVILLLFLFYMQQSGFPYWIAG